jgi:hypothetical protein
MSIHKFSSKKSQSGVTLMLSILVLAAILSIAFSLATVTFVEIRSSGDLIRTEPAYYAADALSEEALFKIKRNIPDNNFTYDSGIGNVTLTSQSSYTSTAIFRTVVKKSSYDFVSTKSHFPIYDTRCPAPNSDSALHSNCLTGGSGYGRIKITFLDTGNNDTLKAFLCQFDPQKPINSASLDGSAYTNVPCSNPNDTSNGYWLTPPGGDSLTSFGTNNTRESGAGSWGALQPNLQQELILYNSGSTADIYVQVETFDSSSQPKGLPLVGSTAVDISASSAGVVRKIRTTIPTSNSSQGSSVIDTTWVEDAIPTGGICGNNSPDVCPWNTVTSNPAPYSGTYAFQSGVGAGMHQMFFSGATNQMSVGTGDKLFAYVYIDPSNLPSEIMLQWNSNSQGWNHRAYWGSDSIMWGTNGTQSRFQISSSLPSSGGWVRLEVPASSVGMEGQTANGMAFTLFNGRASWDKAGKSSVISGGVANVASIDLTGQNNSYAQVSNYSSLNTSTFTLEAWIYPRRLNYGAWQPIVAKEAATGNSRNYGLYVTNGSSKFHYSFNAADCSTYRSYDTSSNLSLNTWNHVAITYDGTSFKAYLNGILDSTQTPPSGICTSSQPIWIGGGQSVFTNNNALIDEVRVWNIVRTQSEISSAKNSLLTGSESGLVGYWKFDENSGNSAANSVSGGNSASFGSQAGWSTSLPFP